MNTQQLSVKDSFKIIKALIKNNKKKLLNKDFVPGRLLMFSYDAKDKTQTFDRTPMAMVLMRGKTHTMCLNFHWAPAPLRVILVKQILALNKNNIKLGKPLEIDYRQLKPFLKKIGAAPIIRLYINKRISSTGVVIPDEHLMDATKLRTESFTQGKVDAETLYKKALSANKKYRQDRKRRE